MRPDISSSVIVGVSCAVLVLLFLVQHWGTTKIGVCFAPIVVLWLLLNLVFGIYVGHPPEAFLLSLVDNGADGDLESCCA